MGQILSCPKCGSMVLIEPPDGEHAPRAAAAGDVSQTPVSEPAPPSAPSGTQPADFAAHGGPGWRPIAFAGIGAVLCVSAIGWYAWSRHAHVTPDPTDLSLTSVAVTDKEPPNSLPREVEPQEETLAETTIDDSTPVIEASPKLDVELIAEDVDPFYEVDRSRSLDLTMNASPIAPPDEEPIPAPVPDTLANLVNLLGDPTSQSSINGAANPRSTSIETSSPKLAKQRDVRQNAERPLRAVRFNNVPLIDFLRAMIRLSNVPISLDPAALEQTGNTIVVPVSVAKLNTSCMDILRAALKPVGMQPVIANHVIRITTPPLNNQQLRHSTFFIGDLLEGDDGSLDWAHFVATLVEPRSWTTGGGPGVIELADDQLKISNTRLATIRTAIFLERMRSARSLPPGKKLPSHLTSVEPLWNTLGQKLERPIDLDIWTESTLLDVISGLETAAEIRILMDWESLAERNIHPTTVAKLYVRDTSLEASIHMLAGDQDLAIVPIDRQTLQITTNATKANMSYVEFYAFDRLSGNGQKVVEQLMLRGTAALDPNSGVAIVVGNPDLHRAFSR